CDHRLPIKRHRSTIRIAVQPTQDDGDDDVYSSYADAITHGGIASFVLDCCYHDGSSRVNATKAGSRRRHHHHQTAIVSSLCMRDVVMTLLMKDLLTICIGYAIERDAQPTMYKQTTVSFSPGELVDFTLVDN